ncbi:MAG: hypothetical protein WKF96_17080 [Solirubrobacteraceae bacterium]
MEANDLQGAFVVEVGVRQAWPFLTFAWPDRDAECRLYIDTTFRVDDQDLADGDPGRAVSALLALSNEYVTEVVVGDNAELTLRFESSPRLVLVVAGTSADFTTGAIWWLGRQ